VVTHLAGARLEGNRLSETWQREVRGFAGLPNTFCKLSAFYHASGTAVPPETAGTYAPLIEEIVSVFGDDRVLFGSNWPVSSLKGPYSPLPVIVREFARARGQDLEDAYFRRNTLRAYGLDAAGRREKGGNTVE
jgi:predicted TIM-barrel fold metal-dependent hydrolase